MKKIVSKKGLEYLVEEERTEEGKYGDIHHAKRGDEKLVVKYLKREEVKRLGRSFEKQNEMMMEIDIPHVIKILDMGTHEGVPFSIMPRMETTLSEHGAFEDPKEGIEFFLRMAYGFQQLHKQCIYHLDPHPRNVLIDSEGRPQITDPGLTLTEDDRKKLQHKKKTSSAQSVEMLAAPAAEPHFYLPEEAIDRDMKNIGPWTDAYSQARLAYEYLPLSLKQTPVGRFLWRIYDKNNLEERRADFPEPESYLDKLQEELAVAGYPSRITTGSGGLEVEIGSPLSKDEQKKLLQSKKKFSLEEVTGLAALVPQIDQNDEAFVSKACKELIENYVRELLVDVMSQMDRMDKLDKELVTDDRINQDVFEALKGLTAASGERREKIRQAFLIEDRINSRFIVPKLRIRDAPPVSPDALTSKTDMDKIRKRLEDVEARSQRYDWLSKTYTLKLPMAMEELGLLLAERTYSQEELLRIVQIVTDISGSYSKTLKKERLRLEGEGYEGLQAIITNDELAPIKEQIRTGKFKFNEFLAATVFGKYTSSLAMEADNFCKSTRLWLSPAKNSIPELEKIHADAKALSGNMARLESTLAQIKVKVPYEREQFSESKENLHAVVSQIEGVYKRALTRDQPITVKEEDVPDYCNDISQILSNEASDTINMSLLVYSLQRAKTEYEEDMKALEKKYQFVFPEQLQFPAGKEFVASFFTLGKRLPSIDLEPYISRQLDLLEQGTESEEATLNRLNILEVLAHLQKDYGKLPLDYKSRIKGVKTKIQNSDKQGTVHISTVPELYLARAKLEIEESADIKSQDRQYEPPTISLFKEIEAEAAKPAKKRWKGYLAAALGALISIGGAIGGISYYRSKKADDPPPAMTLDAGTLDAIVDAGTPDAREVTVEFEKVELMRHKCQVNDIPKIAPDKKYKTALLTKGTIAGPAFFYDARTFKRLAATINNHDDWEWIPGTQLVSYIEGSSIKFMTPEHVFMEKLLDISDCIPGATILNHEWQPDGRTVMLQVQNGKKPQYDKVWRISIKDGTAQEVKVPPNTISFSVSPNGRWLYTHQTGRVHTPGHHYPAAFCRYNEDHAVCALSDEMQKGKITLTEIQTGRSFQVDVKTPDGLLEPAWVDNDTFAVPYQKRVLYGAVEEGKLALKEGKVWMQNATVTGTAYDPKAGIILALQYPLGCSGDDVKSRTILKTKNNVAYGIVETGTMDEKLIEYVAPAESSDESRTERTAPTTNYAELKAANRRDIDYINAVHSNNINQRELTDRLGGLLKVNIMRERADNCTGQVCLQYERQLKGDIQKLLVIVEQYKLAEAKRNLSIPGIVFIGDPNSVKDYNQRVDQMVIKLNTEYNNCRKVIRGCEWYRKRLQEMNLKRANINKSAKEYQNNPPKDDPPERPPAMTPERPAPPPMRRVPEPDIGDIKPPSMYPTYRRVPEPDIGDIKPPSMYPTYKGMK